MDLPAAVARLVDDLARMPGAVAITLGGSRAAGPTDDCSDWDLGVYYRGALDTARLAAHGTVHAPGTWGRIMNGGAWLELDGIEVDVLLRDLDVVEHWSAQAERGVFEVDAVLAYLAGLPTYSLLAERAIGRTLVGTLADVGPFPEPLVATATARWSYSAAFGLEQARMRASRGDVVGTAGQLAKAIVERSHELLCLQRRWVLNEKRIVEAAGLADLQARMRAIPSGTDGLLAWVDDIAAALAAHGS